MTDNRRELYSQRPSTTPRGYVSGLPEAIDAVRSAMRATGPVRDACGNVVEVPLRDLPEALADVRRDRPDLYRALDDFSADYENPLEAIAILAGDPHEVSDVDTVGTLDAIPIYR